MNRNHRIVRNDRSQLNLIEGAASLVRGHETETDDGDDSLPLDTPPRFILRFIFEIFLAREKAPMNMQFAVTLSFA